MAATKTIIASALLTGAVIADETLTTYHMFEPKYTGLADKDAGDYEGEVAFIFMTFKSYEASNPEAAIGQNVFEMSTVNVTGWDKYAMCNAPGAPQCRSSTSYCCAVTGGTYQPTQTTLPGKKNSAKHGYWFSFPKESEGVTWTETIQRRIQSSCVAQAWRDEAGGCPDCQDLATECVANCIQAALDDTTMKAVWDRAFSNETMCPNQPFPIATMVV